MRGVVFEFTYEECVESRLPSRQQLRGKSVFPHRDGVKQHDFGLKLTSKERHMMCGADAAIRKVDRKENSSYVWHEAPLANQQWKRPVRDRLTRDRDSMIRRSISRPAFLSVRRPGSREWRIRRRPAAPAAGNRRRAYESGRGECRHLSGNPKDVIVDHAAESAADFIFIGAHEEVGKRRFLLGSVAKAVLRAAPCSVEVLRAPATHCGVPRPPRVLLA